MITKSRDSGNCVDMILDNLEKDPFDELNYRSNFRIAEFNYNYSTGELIIKLKPDVVKRVVLGASLLPVNSLITHKNTVDIIADIEDFDNWDHSKKYVVLPKYWEFKTEDLEWTSLDLVAGDEFYCLSDNIKYRYLNEELVNVVDVTLSSAYTLTEDGSDTGIEIATSPSTSAPIHLHHAGKNLSGLMSSSDKIKLDNIEDTIGALLEVGDPVNLKFPIHLKTADGNITLSTIWLTEERYISSFSASVATTPSLGIAVGDRILVITLTNGDTLQVSLEPWLTSYTGSSTNSIKVSTDKNTIKADLLIDLDPENLSSVTNDGLLTKLLWANENGSVRFVKGIKEDYNSTTYKGYVYLATDTREIIVDGIAYGLDLLSPTLELVKKISFKDNVFTITNSNNLVYTIDLLKATQATDGLFSKEDKIKLDNIEARALVNILESIQVDGNVVPMTGKIAMIDLTHKANIVDVYTIPVIDKKFTDVQTEIDDLRTSTSSVYRTRPSVPTEADLPMTGNLNGDVRNVIDTNINYVWNDTDWDPLGGTTEIATETSDGLMSSEYVKTLNKAVQGATIGGVVISKTGTTLNFPAYPILQGGIVAEPDKYIDSISVNNHTISATSKLLPGITKTSGTGAGELVTAVVGRQVFTRPIADPDIPSTIARGGDYVKKTGDTMSGNLLMGNNRISFDAADPNVCLVGAANSRIATGYSPAIGFNTGSLLVSNAWSDNVYVPTNGIYCKGSVISNTADPALWVDSTNVHKAAFGWKANSGAFLFSAVARLYLGILDNGTPHYSGSTLWHAGNSNLSTVDWACRDLLSDRSISVKANNITTTISSIGSNYYCVYDTTAPSGHYFNKNVYVVGDTYGGSSYNRRLAYVDEIAGIKSNSARYADKLTGFYTGNGGYQKPNYFGLGGALYMMNSLPGTSGYYDCFIMNSYISDVPFCNMIAGDKNGYGNFYLFQQNANSDTWINKGRFWHSTNSNLPTVPWSASSFNVGTAGSCVRDRANYLSLVSYGNELCITGSSSMVVNYRADSTVPTDWYWRAGTSTSWSNHLFGSVTANGNVIATGYVYSEINKRVATVDQIPTINKATVVAALNLAGTNTFTLYCDFKGGAGNSASDMRFKSHIKSLEPVLDKILLLDIFYYDWDKKGEERSTFGLNATLVKELFPLIVHEREDEDKTLWLEYDRAGVIALKAILELMEEVKELKSELADLKKLK